MKNYKMTVQYDGSRYYGWQRLPGKDTIQGKLEEVLSRLCGSEIEVNGAGRTDAGVHARAMTASMKMETGSSAEEIKDYLNRYLPEDIAVTEVKEASERFHARYKAVGKTYCYSCYVGRDKPVFQRKYVYVPEKCPNIEAMRKAAVYLTGEQDYMAFCGNTKMKKSTVRKVDRIEIVRKGDYLTFTFHGDGFLQNMVRIMVGTLLEVGEGLRTPESMADVLASRRRAEAGAMAPAKGLCLMEVEY